MTGAGRTPATPPALPLRRECPYHPPRAYEELRDRGPLTEVRLFDGRTVWAVTGHGLVRDLLSDARLSVDRSHPDFPRLTRVLTSVPPERRRAMQPLLSTDPPLHAEQRRALLAGFTLKRVRALRPALEGAADAHLNEMVAEQGPATDLVAAYVRPLVTTGISLLLGVRGRDESVLKDLLSRHFDPIPALMDHFTALLNDGSGPVRPDTDLLGHLHARIAEGTLAAEDAARYLTVLVVAGQDVTVHTIAVGVLALLAHPAQLAGLRSGQVPWPGAIEELLRFVSLTGGLVRLATADIPTTAGLIRAGDGVLLLNPAANRDPAVFDRPHELDLLRPARSHLTFGFGVHQCIGHNLARLDLEVALRRLFTRLPSLRLTVPVEQVPLRQGLVSGITSLPVSW
ncbi:cytochrome P450 [Kitasatospora sp. NPDC057542]|uniref:cytochrome P450 n=1 Tax=Streptomycetaceae TaxID=2062 RepID=UPI001CCA0443|nr:cytochrome P450 [Streptomyces sp. LS1784]